MSSAEKDRIVWQNAGDDEDKSAPHGAWFYTSELNVTYGPFDTQEEATEAMQLHGLEE